MTIIAGDYFDGRHSRPVKAELHASSAFVSVRGGGQELVPPNAWEGVEVSARLGDTPRFLRFADGAKFETADNAAIDALLRERGGHDWLHHLESRLRYVALGVAVVVAFVWSLVHYGIPAFAERVAFALPAETARQLDRHVLAMLDEHLLEPSTLTPAERQRLERRFAAVISGVDPRYRIDVAFRSAAGSIGPNALALPSGTVVFTDELVRLAANDDELLAVLAHEIGHVVRRHGLRQAIQGSLLSAAAVLIVGDLSSVSSMVTALPVILTELGYSREFEREADAHAVAVLQEQAVGVEAFASVLRRLDQALRCKEAAPCEAHPDDGRWTSYLATHPPTAERLRWIREWGGA